MHWAYIAGIIDGEGTISIVKLKGKYCHSRTARLEPRIEVYNCNKELIETLHSFLGGSITLRKPRVNRQPQYYLRLRSFHLIIPVLENTLPYLIVKKEQATLLLKFCQRRIREDHAFYTDTDFRLHAKMRKLNLRGRAKLSQTS